MKTKHFIQSRFKILLVVNVFLFTYGCIETPESKNEKPVCSISRPINGEEIQQGQSVEIVANASDEDGEVTEVSFYIDGKIRGVSQSYPYRYNWNTSTENTGIHIIKAVAKDDKDETTNDEISIHLIEKVSEGNKPIASFSVNQTNISTGTSIQFTDLSTNNPTFWYWEFGDGSTSNNQNPNHTYNSEGSFTVSLLVGNNYGNNTETKYNYITVNNSSNVFFSEDFNDNSFGWFEHVDDSSYSTITNGYYEYYYLRPGYIRYTTREILNINNLTDFEIEFRIKFIPHDENEFWSAYLLWDYLKNSDNNVKYFNYFGIQQYSSSAKISMGNHNEYWNKWDYGYTETNFIHSEYNILTIKKVNNNCQYFLNGNLIYTTNEFIDINNNRIGFGIDDGTMFVDYIYIYELNSGAKRIKAVKIEEPTFVAKELQEDDINNK